MPLFAATIRITAVPDQAAGSTAAQRDRLRELNGAGRIRLAGVLDREDGFLVVFEAEDLLDARDTVESFPLVRDGMAAWTLRAFSELEL